MEIQWALVLFTVVSGVGAWLFAFSMLQSLLKRGEAPGKGETVAAFVLMAAGGCMSVAHLKHVDRIFEALNHPTSGIFIEAALIGVSCVLLAVYFALIVRGAGKGPRVAVGAVTAAVCAVFTFACGSSYMMEARPAWTTVALPLAYCATAAVSGAGLNLLVKAAGKQDGKAVSFAGVLAVAAGVVAAVVAAAFSLHAASWLAAADNGALAWAVAMFVGIAVAVAGGAVAWKKPQGAMALAAAVLAAGLVAALALRIAMWLSGTPTMDFFLMPLE